MAPIDHRQALAAVQAPLLVVVGSAAEAFVASAYAEVLRESGHGVLETIDDAGHDGILRDGRAMTAVTRWVSSLRQMTFDRPGLAHPIRRILRAARGSRVEIAQ